MTVFGVTLGGVIGLTILMIAAINLLVVWALVRNASDDPYEPRPDHDERLEDIFRGSGRR